MTLPEVKTIFYRAQDLRQYLIDFRDRPDVKDGSFLGAHHSYIHQPSDGGTAVDTKEEIHGVCCLLDSWIAYELAKQVGWEGKVQVLSPIFQVKPDVTAWPMANGSRLYPIGESLTAHKEFDTNRYHPFAKNDYCDLRRELLDWCIEWAEGKNEVVTCKCRKGADGLETEWDKTPQFHQFLQELYAS